MCWPNGKLEYSLGHFLFHLIAWIGPRAAWASNTQPWTCAETSRNMEKKRLKAALTFPFCVAGMCCAQCGISPETGLKRCARCHSTMYCSKDCQVRHWKEGGHKQKCEGNSCGVLNILINTIKQEFCIGFFSRWVLIPTGVSSCNHSLLISLENANLNSSQIGWALECLG